MALTRLQLLESEVAGLIPKLDPRTASDTALVRKQTLEICLGLIRKHMATPSSPAPRYKKAKTNPYGGGSGKKLTSTFLVTDDQETK